MYCSQRCVILCIITGLPFISYDTVSEITSSTHLLSQLLEASIEQTSIRPCQETRPHHHHGTLGSLQPLREGVCAGQQLTNDCWVLPKVLCG